MKILQSDREYLGAKGLGKLDSPPATVLLIPANVPLPWIVGVDSDHAFSIVECIRDIDVEVLPVESILDSIAASATAVFNLPLR